MTESVKPETGEAPTVQADHMHLERIISSLRQRCDAQQQDQQQLLEQVATLTAQIEACAGNDASADSSEWSHSAQIDGLCSHLEDARAHVAMLTARLDGASNIAGMWAEHAEHAEEQVATLNERLAALLEQTTKTVDFHRGMAERLAEDRDVQKHKAREAEAQVATLTEALRDEIAEQDGGPNAEYCWWCGCDINGKNGPVQAHDLKCWRIKAEAALAAVRGEPQ